jgi:hypothetical protein
MWTLSVKGVLEEVRLSRLGGLGLGHGHGIYPPIYFLVGASGQGSDIYGFFCEFLRIGVVAVGFLEMGPNSDEVDDRSSIHRPGGRISSVGDDGVSFRYADIVLGSAASLQSLRYPSLCGRMFRGLGLRDTTSIFF